MRLSTVAAFTFLFLQAGQGRGPAQPQRQTLLGGIEGLVLQAVSGEPLAKAQVTLTQIAALNPAFATSPPAAPIPPTMTGSDGKFAFENLEPGSYRIVAVKNGFVRMNYGERFSGGAGSIVDVPAGQTLKDVTFRLVPTAAISGRVVDASGEPGTGLSIQLLKTSYNVSGQRTFQAVGVARTDDRGEYRLFWISPGRYYLAVTPNRGATMLVVENLILGTQNEVTPGAQAPVYYPGTVDPLRASTLDVVAGGELVGINVLLPQQSVYRVRGRVVDSSSGQPPRTATISLIPRDNAFAAVTTTSLLSGTTFYNPATGTFELRDIVAGAYWLRAQAASESTGPATITPNLVGRTLAEAASLSATGSRGAVAQLALDIAGDIEGVVLSTRFGLSVSGSLRVEGPSLPATPAARIALRPTAPNGLSSQTQPVNADGTFTLLNVFPGEYRIMVTPMPTDYYIKEARIDQTDVLNQPWVIGGAIRGNLEVVLSSAAGQIEGTVVDARSQPVSGLQAILIPDQDRPRSDLIKSALTDKNGHFTFRGVSPGNYKIFAWEALEANAYFDPEVLRQYEQQGKTVRVTEGAKLTSEVKVIPARQ